MIVLGINGGFRQGYQDVSACLVEDGRILAAVEEERLNRVKYSPGRLPFLSVTEVLSIGDKHIHEVDLIAFHGETWGDGVAEKVTDYFRSQFGHAPQLHMFHHHDCHAASAFYASGFDRALIVTVDGSGDGVSLQISVGESGVLRCIHRDLRPNSLGIFYSLITQYCGFVKDSDEYKLMGLSTYGNPDSYQFDWLIDFQNGKLRVDQHYLVPMPEGTPAPHRDEMLFSKAFEERMGRRRRIPETKIDSFYQDVAASAQSHLEKLMLRIVQHYISETGISKVCLAGGVALNCVANQQLMNADVVTELFVQPASNDAGISLGAAWLGAMMLGDTPVRPNDTYLGREYSDGGIEDVLIGSKIDYRKVTDSAAFAAEQIAKGKVVGWFQGKSEFGPRALGNRSILANAQQPEMKDKVNRAIKFREAFRPFCPSVIASEMHHYFKGNQLMAPYMTITYDALPSAIGQIPAVIHDDGTARIQTVDGDQNPLYLQLLQELKLRIGHGVVLNTSFNRANEPMVYSPRDALATFFSSGLDVLVMGSFIVEK